MKILAEDLQRLCYNATQFSAKDSSLKGVVYFHFDGNGTLEVYASDDYVAMVDRAPAEAAELDFWLGLKEVKELEKWLRDQEGELNLYLDLDQLGTGRSSEDIEIQRVTEPPDFGPVVDVVWSESNPLAEDHYPASREPFAIRSERFTKFRLLRPPPSPSCKDGYPIDFTWDGRLVRWKCGPLMNGVIGPLARHSFIDQVTGEQVVGIKQLYADEEGVLW